MKHEAAVKILAKEFSMLMVKQLGKAKVQKVNRLNLEETDSGVWLPTQQRARDNTTVRHKTGGLRRAA